MLTDALVAPPLLLAIVLIMSGVAKLRDSGAVVDSFRTLRLPAQWVSWGAPAALPWAEILLGCALLVTSGWVYLLAAVTSAMLFLTYLAIIARATRFEEKVECGCLGKLGLGIIGPITVARNTLLVATSLLAVVDATGSRSVLARMGSNLAWLAMLALAVVLTGFMVRGSRTGEHAAPASLPSPIEVDDYQRMVIPYLTLTDSSGAITTVRELALRQARLLVYVNPHCGACVPVLEALPGFRRTNPELGAQAIFADAASAASPYVPVEVRDDHFLDHEAVFVRAFEISSPGALLLGVDGFLAGGPVSGTDAVLQFMADITAQLEDARLQAAAAAVLSTGM